MITSKRDLKKHINRIQDEVAQVVVPAAVYAGVFDEEKAAEVLTQLAQLTVNATSRLSIGFDKAPSAFDSMSAYKKARREYFKDAYNKALADYEEGVNKLIAPVNAKK